MHIVLFDKADWRMGLYPLALTRPVSDLRVGILTIAEKWGKWLGATYSFLTEDYLAEKYPLGDVAGDVWVIRGNCCPNDRLFEAVMALEVGQVLTFGSEFVAFRGEAGSLLPWHPEVIAQFRPVAFTHDVVMINHPEDLFLNNGEQISVDFDLLTKGRSSASLSASNRFLGERIFAEEGAQAEFSTFNSLKGPIYLGRNSEVWEGSHIRGAFALGDYSQVKMGTRIYSNVTVGPYSRVGGELNTCVIWGRSAKGHDGYLGSSVMGEWCNWGADTNNSNLKNTYKSVRVYDYRNQAYRDSGLQFCGAIMADHVRCAINTAFNTGTVVGVGANVFGAGMPPTFVPDFSWGDKDGLSTYRLDKFFETASLVYERRDLVFNEVEKRLLTAVFELTRRHREQAYNIS